MTETKHEGINNKDEQEKNSMRKFSDRLLIIDDAVFAITDKEKKKTSK